MSGFHASPIMIKLLRTEFSFDGRLGLSGFWLRHLLLVPLSLYATPMAERSGFESSFVLALAVWMASVWTRRLHDRNRRVWWLALAAVPVVGVMWLWWQCGFSGTSAASARFGAAPAVDLPGVPASHVVDPSNPTGYRFNSPIIDAA